MREGTIAGNIVASLSEHKFFEVKDKVYIVASMLALGTVAKSVSQNLDTYEVPAIATVFHVSDSSDRLCWWNVGM